jgi:hypothetical protein
MNKNPPLWRTRRHPPSHGENIKTRCDIVIHLDHKQSLNDISLKIKKLELQANRKHVTIFVKSDPEFLEKFILLHPSIKIPFILITGDGDRTLPTQTDSRYKKYSQDFVRKLKAIANAPNLINWYAENLETQFNKKVIPIPLGFRSGRKHPCGTDDFLWQARNNWKSSKLYQPRKPKIIATYKIRKGNQHDDRRYVVDTFKKNDMFMTNRINSADWLETLSKSSHVICVHGGGLDLCPRLFEALWMGSVPIAVRANVSPMCLKDFPIYWIDAWKDLPNIIRTDAFWAEQENYYYQLNNLSEEKFTMDYWWRKIQKNEIL